ncbi:DUF5916 domain-containing protein [Roseivirga sp.]|uniref:carbohydrate binding family 9 domain-containing protein n=1 Tax=Roseivirga sp. TaxID=1964215 RepID=UPI003B8BB6D3
MKPLFNLLLLLITANIIAQESTETRDLFTYNLNSTSEIITIDGAGDDLGWNNAEKINQFINHWPTDQGVSNALSEVWATYDAEFIYIKAKLFDTGERVVQSLRRDNRDAHWNSDNFTVVIDPFNNKQSGFFFGVNAGGAQMEALLSLDGGRTEFDENWDNKWYSEVKQYADHWLVEMAIPMKTLRYDTQIADWGINFIRGDMKRNEFSTWTQFPLNYGGIDLNFMGTLKWEMKPEKAKGKVVLIPYLAGGTQRDFEDAEGETNYVQDFDAGIDAKVAVTGSLSLDLTLNPDFSNVDVDQQVTNLTRFSIFFPERRNFFLENGDIFSNFGSWQIQPFFSRTIGLSEGQQVPINYGARLTGNLTKDMRLGVMNIQTGETNESLANNYTVAAVHQKVLKRSVLKALFINRQAGDDFGRNGGLEFNYVHPTGTWDNTVRFHAATTDEKLGKNTYYGLSGGYRGRHLRGGWTFDRVGENYITELGFNPRINNFDAITELNVRKGFTRNNVWSVYRFFPKSDKSILNQHGPRTWHWLYNNPDGSLNERNHGLGYDFMFKNTSELRFNRFFTEVNLPVATNLIGSDTPLPASNFKFTDYNINFNTDRRKVFNTEWTLRYGDFYNGTRYGLATGLNVRAQPWGTFGVNYEYNRVELAEGFGETKLHLFRANTEISFSNTMFWTTSIQYNSQSENYNIFSRFQWRFKPMSDFFLVYTDNYGNDGLNIKNRQIVFKVTYWLNM